MPRYFFDLKGSGAVDEEGMTFPDDDAAIAEAMLVAKDLGRNRNASSVHFILVRNERGKIVHEQPLIWN